MIVTQQPLTNVMQSEELNGFVNTGAPIDVPTEDDAIDFCFCNFRCEYIELAFYDAGLDVFKNDTTSILINIVDPLGSFELFIVDNGLEIALNDATFGTFFNLGDLAQPSKGGYIVDWLKVFNNLGNNDYILRAKVTEFGSTITQDSHIYRIMPYSDAAADETVRFRTVNNGCIFNGIDYTGLDWPRSIRIAGKVGNEQPQLEQINTLDSERRPIQIQESTRDRFTFESKQLPSTVYDFMKSDLKADVILLDSWQIFAFRELRGEPVTLESFEEVNTDFSRTDFGNIKINFDSKTLQLKRNI